MTISRPAAALAALIACAPAFALDVAGLDRSVDPCTDFYNYANGPWLRTTVIPDDRSRLSMFDSIDERNEKDLLAVLDAALRGEGLPPQGSAQRKAVEYFRSGMDRDGIEKAGITPLAPLLGKVDGVKDIDTLAAALAMLHTQGITAAFSFSVRPDAKNSATYLAHFDQGGLGLSDRDDYFRDDERSVRVRAAYVDHVARILEVAGAGAEAARAQAQAVFAFEKRLAGAAFTAVERRDVDLTYNKTSIARLSADASFPWRPYLDALGAAQVAEANVIEPKFMQMVARLAGEASWEDWRTYLRWHVYRSTASKLPERFARPAFDFYEGVLLGRKAESPRPRTVLRLINGRVGSEPLGQAMGRLFVERLVPAETKPRVEAMIGNIKAALAERLGTLEWMSEETRGRALEKVTTMRSKVGWPDKWTDYSRADIGAYSFVQNWMNSKSFAMARMVERAGKPVDRDEWNYMGPHIVNASYNRSNNEITIPAGILRPPFYDPQADDAANYGAIGMTIGHEITHGFDANGRRFDAKGNMNDWWTPEDARRYVERAGRVERQYGAFVGVDDIKVNGKLTITENISDIGGLKISYLALQKALREKPQGKIDGLTPEQRYFIAFAQKWRATYRPEQERQLLRTDSHSPPRFRVAGAIANLPEFAEAFSCDAKRALLSESERANLW
jgi:predicted metalloendopeptidase